VPCQSVTSPATHNLKVIRFKSYPPTNFLSEIIKIIRRKAAHLLLKTLLRPLVI
jgi:hypothetical protein